MEARVVWAGSSKLFKRKPMKLTTEYLLSCNSYLLSLDLKSYLHNLVSVCCGRYGQGLYRRGACSVVAAVISNIHRERRMWAQLGLGDTSALLQVDIPLQCSQRVSLFIQQMLHGPLACSQPFF